MDVEINFKVSNGWFEKFKERHGLSFKKLCGESEEVDAATVNGWRKEQFKSLLEKYELYNVFNADEKTLYYTLFF